ncbi:MAG: protein translocase subunit SecF [Caulobacteraceae bacterium]|nr:protein translocase subunit SecF [Caulobacteraceae bacterium]
MRFPLTRYLPHDTKVDFVRAAPIAAVLSALALIGSVVSFTMLGLNLGVDFAGGSSMQVNTPGRAAPVDDLRKALAEIGAHDVLVQSFGERGDAATVRFKDIEGVESNQAVKFVEQKLGQRFPGMRFQGGETISPTVSGELFLNGLKALGIALLLMLAYIWFRFQLQFGLGAVAAVFHDLILTMGLLSVMQIEFSMSSIAALLTVIGYSMNEKVITFDRLRENLRKYKTTPLRDVINLSENERLSRTLITGTTAILSLAGALVWGGPVLFPLVFTMVFGVMIGTYSSIYVALPIILLWGAKRGGDDETPIDLTKGTSVQRQAAVRRG